MMTTPLSGNSAAVPPCGTRDVRWLQAEPPPKSRTARLLQGCACRFLVAALATVCALQPLRAELSENTLPGGESPAKAIESFQRQLEGQPGNSEITYNLAVAFYASGEYEQAARLWKQVSEKGFGSIATDARAQIGNAHFRRGETLEGETPEATAAFWEEAVRTYQAALASNPNQELAAANLPVVREKTLQLLDQFAEAKVESVAPKAEDAATLQRNIENLRLGIHYTDRAIAVAPEETKRTERRAELQDRLEDTLLANARKLRDDGTTQEKTDRDKATDLYNQALGNLDEFKTAKSDQPESPEPDSKRSSQVGQLEEEIKKQLANNLLETAREDASEAQATAATMDKFMEDMKSKDWKVRRKRSLETSPLEQAGQQIAEAEAKVDEAVALQPDDPETKKNADQIKKELSQILAEHGDRHEEQAQSAKEPEVKASEFQAASESYAKALELDPENQHAKEKSEAIAQELAKKAMEKAAELANQAQETLEQGKTKELASLMDQLPESPLAPESLEEKGFQTPEAEQALQQLAREQADKGGFSSPETVAAAQKAAELYEQAQDVLAETQAGPIDPKNTQVESARAAMQANSEQLQNRLEQAAKDGKHLAAAPGDSQSESSPEAPGSQEAPGSPDAKARQQLASAKGKMTFQAVGAVGAEEGKKTGKGEASYGDLRGGAAVLDW